MKFVDAVSCADLSQRGAVGPGVVGHQPLDARDASVGEEPDVSSEEGCAGRILLVGQDLGVGQSGWSSITVDVVVTDTGVLLPLVCPWARPLAFHPPPSWMRPSQLTSICSGSPGRARS
jgi:hypothetical protein